VIGDYQLSRIIEDQFNQYRIQIVQDSLLINLVLCLFMFLKGMMITNQLLYQLSYKGMGGYINQKPYFAIQNKIFCSQLLLKLLAYCVGKLLIVTNKSSPNRLQNLLWNRISNFIPFLTKVQINNRNDYDTKKKKK
jgi:hypothetical protein|tara:strand:+ start:1718 stop:2125 length:408 start_codon:yes stop_codon:yes gene_type:complete